MCKPEPVRENEMEKIHWDSVIKTAHLIPARRPDTALIKKKKELGI